jgi:peptide/nickel transport system substrate-binding protein
MTEESNYWKRLAKKRLSRRRLLGGAMGVGAGLTAASLVGCAGEEEEGPTATATPTAGTPAGTVTATPTVQRPGEIAPDVSPGFYNPIQLEPVKEGSRGGILRWFGYDALPPDSFDPYQTQFGPVYSMHSSVFSKVLQYDAIPSGVIVPDLAVSMPEVVDQTTYVIQIRDGVRFHDSPRAQKYPGLPGRQLTGEDVKYMIERQVNKDSPQAGRYYRMSQWETVDKVEVGPDPLTVTITTKQPTAPFIHFLADTNAFVVAKETVDEITDTMIAPDDKTDPMVGTGPFMLDEYTTLQVVKVRKNPDWFAKDDLADIGLPDRPIIDGYDCLWPVQDDTATEAAFKSKQIDSTSYEDSSNAYRIARETGCENPRPVTCGFINSRFLTADSDRATTPWKDARLRKAISLAVDRVRLGQQLWGEGFYVFDGPVVAGITRWALPYDELIKKPGYRWTRAEREEDVAEAKRLWEAAGGESIEPLDERVVVYAGIPDFIPKVWPQFQKMFSDNLGYQLNGHVDSSGYTELDQCFLAKSCLFSLGYDNGWIDLDDFVYPYYHTDGAKNSFNLSDPTLDEMLEAQRAEFDFERRRELGYEIQHYLLDEVNAMLCWVSNSWTDTKWGYRRNYRPTPWFGSTFLLANEWIDRSHPDYQGRPA